VNQHQPDKRELYSITELAREFGISTRAIRFYESRDLLSPQRVSPTRVFRRRDRGRLILILRGKRLGFSLNDISDYLDLYDTGDEYGAQNALLLEKVDERLIMLNSQLADLETTITELNEIRKLARERLAEI